MGPYSYLHTQDDENNATPVTHIPSYLAWSHTLPTLTSVCFPPMWPYSYLHTQDNREQRHTFRTRGAGRRGRVCGVCQRSPTAARDDCFSQVQACHRLGWFGGLLNTWTYMCILACAHVPSLIMPPCLDEKADLKIPWCRCVVIKYPAVDVLWFTTL